MDADGSVSKGKEQVPSAPPPGKQDGLVRRIWTSCNVWTLVIAGIAGAPFVYPLVGIALSHIPGVNAWVNVQYPPELAGHAAPFYGVLNGGIKEWLVSRREMLMVQGSACDFWIGALSAAAFAAMLVFFVLPALVVCFRRRKGFVAFCFMLIGVMLWMRLGTVGLAKAFDSDPKVAGCLWPSYESWQRNLDWFCDLLKYWTAIRTSYFGHDLSPFARMGDFFHGLWKLALQLSLVFAGFSALGFFNFSWRSALSKTVPSGIEGEDEDDEEYEGEDDD